MLARLRQTGAILAGQLTTDEFACMFSIENAHYGDTGNPHDPARIPDGFAALQVARQPERDGVSICRSPAL